MPQIAAQYEPIYGPECSICNNSPIVGVRSPSNKLASTDLCGPHFFGETIMLDPELWNTPREATE